MPKIGNKLKMKKKSNTVFVVVDGSSLRLSSSDSFTQENKNQDCAELWKRIRGCSVPGSFVKGAGRLFRMSQSDLLSEVAAGSCDSSNDRVWWGSNKQL